MILTTVMRINAWSTWLVNKIIYTITISKNKYIVSMDVVQILLAVTLGLIGHHSPDKTKQK